MLVHLLFRKSFCWSENLAALTSKCRLYHKAFQNQVASRCQRGSPNHTPSQKKGLQHSGTQVRGMKAHRNPFTKDQQEEWRKKNKTILTYIVAAGVGMIGMSYAAVPLYRLYCQLVPGETALAFYKAKNPTDKPIIGISTYNVVPFEAGQYFNKIQCFCFEEQRLNPNEEVDMPVFFYIDPEFDEDPRMARVNTITLSYTFFEAKEGQKLPLPGYSQG